MKATQRPMQACFSEGREAFYDIIIFYNCAASHDTSGTDQISIGGGENEAGPEVSASGLFYCAEKPSKSLINQSILRHLEAR